jgi:hypothetical protein
MADILVNNPNWQSFASGLEQDRGLQPGLLRAVAMNETGGGNPDIINQTSSAGAQGMFQFMPGTAAEHNVNVNDPADSTRGAADYLGNLTKKFGDPLLAGAAYNCGPGNVSQAQAKAAQAGLPTDAMSLAQNGFLPKETANYVVKLASQLQAPQSQAPAQPAAPQVQPFSPDLINSTRQQVVAMTQAGASPIQIVQALSQSPVGSMIQQMTSSGGSAQDIVNQVGGAPLQALQAAQAKVAGQGFGTNLMQGASNAVDDMGNGLSQLGSRITGNTQALQQEQTQQAALDADPTRQAVGNTAGGMIGSGATKALPYVAATALAPEGMIPAMLANAAVGAGEGAATPTTGDGQILGNIGSGAAWGAAGGGVGHLIGSGLSGLASKALAADPEAAARIAAGQAEGLPVNVSAASGPNSFWRNVLDGASGTSAAKGAIESSDAAITSKVGEGLGLQNYTGPIDHNMLNSASSGIQAALDNSTNVQVALPKTIGADLDNIVNVGTNPLTKSNSGSSFITNAVNDIKSAATGSGVVNGGDLQGAISDLKSGVLNSDASYSQKQVAGNLVDHLNNLLTSNMTPAQEAAYTTANGQYRNLMAVQKMVSASNDMGVVSPRQILQAAKTGGFKSAFLKGDAPYQDLASTASDLYGPANGQGLGNVVSKVLNSNHGLSWLSAQEALSSGNPLLGLGALAAKALAGHVIPQLAASESPTLVRLLSGASGVNISPELQSYIAKALGSVGAGSTSPTQ